MERKQILERLRHLAEGEDYHGRVQVRRAHTGVPKYVSAEIADHAGDHYFSMAKLFRAAADLLESDGWVSGKDRLPEPHGIYEVRRDGDVHTCTVCYGMHSPWWIAKVFGRDAEPVAFMSDDEWRPIPTPPGGDHD